MANKVTNMFTWTRTVTLKSVSHFFFIFGYNISYKTFLSKKNKEHHNLFNCLTSCIFCMAMHNGKKYHNNPALDSTRPNEFGSMTTRNYFQGLMCFDVIGIIFILTFVVEYCLNQNSYQNSKKNGSPENISLHVLFYNQNFE